MTPSTVHLTLVALVLAIFQVVGGFDGPLIARQDCGTTSTRWRSVRRSRNRNGKGGRGAAVRPRADDLEGAGGAAAREVRTGKEER